jgi:hypothetical protein
VVTGGKQTLAQANPELVPEAMFDAGSVTPKSGKQLPWRCSLGHDWLAPPIRRTTQNEGCPFCSGHRVMPGFNDLATTQPALVPEALFDPTTVTASSNKKLPWRCSLGHEWAAKAADRTRGQGCPYCANKRVLPGFNDLATTYPEVAAEALFDPTTVTAGVTKKLPWRCAQGHEWAAQVYSRTKLQTGCPTCARWARRDRVKPPRTAPFRVRNELRADLATSHPELAEEAQFDATSVHAGTSARLPWRCPKGHEYLATVDKRVRGDGCPYCSGHKVLAGFNDLATTHPDLVREAMFDPTTVNAGSNKRQRWKCVHGHEWVVPVAARTRGSGCPFCANKAVLPGYNDLSTTHPELAREACFDATAVTSGSSMKVDWQCQLGHRWNTTVASRTRANNGCPYCGNKAVLPGFNDLATLRPDLARQALFDATSVTTGSDKVGRWCCDVGHEWEAPVGNRSRGAGCPFCSGRRLLAGFNDLGTTNPELAQQACFDPSTVSAGMDVLVPWICSDGHRWEAKVVDRARGQGCPVCSGRQLLVGFNDLATTHPQLAAEALFDPTTVMAGASLRLKWRCASGHEWETLLSNRVNHGTGCPFCGGRSVLPGFNDLATVHPVLAAEALFDPTTVTAGSPQKRPWRCSAGHEWTAPVSARSNGQGCPYCAGRRVLPGFNDLASARPDLVPEAQFDATTVTQFSSKKVPWQCREGHQWQATVANRTRAGSGCPTCAKTGFKPGLRGWLYLLEHPSWELLQIGITNAPEVRVGEHLRRGWLALDVRGPMDGVLTRDWERAILEFLREIGVHTGIDSAGGRFDGYTEAWRRDEFRARRVCRLECGPPTRTNSLPAWGASPRSTASGLLHRFCSASSGPSTAAPD